MSDFTFNKLILKINSVVHPILKGKRARNLYIQPVGPFPFETDEFFTIVSEFLQIFFNTNVKFLPKVQITDLEINSRPQKSNPDSIQYSQEPRKVFGR